VQVAYTNYQHVTGTDNLTLRGTRRNSAEQHNLTLRGTRRNSVEQHNIQKPQSKHTSKNGDGGGFASPHLTSPREPPGGPTAHNPPPASSSAPVHSLPLSRGAVLVLAVVGSRVQSSPAHSSISPARRWVSSQAMRRLEEAASAPPPARAPPVSEAGRPDLSGFKYSRLPGADQLSEDPCL
jgi:hypothetical protein